MQVFDIISPLAELEARVRQESRDTKVDAREINRIQNHSNSPELSRIKGQKDSKGTILRYIDANIVDTTVKKEITALPRENGVERVT